MVSVQDGALGGRGGGGSGVVVGCRRWPVVKGAAAFCCSTEREGWTDDVGFRARQIILH